MCMSYKQTRGMLFASSNYTVHCIPCVLEWVSSALATTQKMPLSDRTVTMGHSEMNINVDLIFK